MGPMGERDFEHLLGRSHLQVQGKVYLGHQPVDVVIGDVPAILAQVGGDPVGPGPRRRERCPYRIRVTAAAGIPDGRDVVDIDAQAEPPRHAGSVPDARLPGFTAGMASSAGGSASAE